MSFEKSVIYLESVVAIGEKGNLVAEAGVSGSWLGEGTMGQSYTLAETRL